MRLCPPPASGGQYVIYAITLIYQGETKAGSFRFFLTEGVALLGRVALFRIFSEQLFTVHVLTHKRILGAYEWENSKWHFAARNGTTVTVWSLAKPWRVAVAACFLYLYVNVCIA